MVTLNQDGEKCRILSFYDDLISQLVFPPLSVVCCHSFTETYDSGQLVWFGGLTLSLIYADGFMQFLAFNPTVAQRLDLIISGRLP